MLSFPPAPAAAAPAPHSATNPRPPKRIAPKSKHHIRCSFKEANISFPAHSRFTMPKPGKLLLHFTPTVGADLVVLAFLLIVQTVLVQQKVIDTHNQHARLVVIRCRRVFGNNKPLIPSTLTISAPAPFWPDLESRKQTGYNSAWNPDCRQNQFLAACGCCCLYHWCRTAR